MGNSSALFEGKAVRVLGHDGGIREIQLDLQGESANRFNALTLSELDQAIAAVEKDAGTKGVLLTSAKDAFLMGADITEFTGYFQQPDEVLEQWLWKVHRMFNRIEDLNAPVVAAIQGFCLGGGCEYVLSAHFRVGASNVKIGLPETKLGIYPGWGGTVRLSRIAGADVAIEWVASGNQWKADDALKAGVLDGVVELDQLREAALRTLRQAIDGKLDWRARAAQKKGTLKLSAPEMAMCFGGSRAFVAGQAGPNYPAPIAAIDAMEQGALKARDEALAIEAKGFVKVAKTPQATALVGVFLADQYAKRLSKKMSSGAAPVKSAAVLGAGIMGGGIAYQSASSKIPAVMNDIKDEQLALGMSEASKILGKLVEKGKLTPAKMAGTLSMIRPTLSMGEIKDTDFIVEAVVENEKVKASVLAEVEATVRTDAIVSSNTSTISINKLAKHLKRPENFCGMHFFNPVHRMPLVEIIRGEKTSEKTVATAVAYATAMGKTAIVVNDCPGFLVNRLLFPYFGGFSLLLRDGVDFERIDKVMEKFGWPMGPAYLLDVVGIDTANHAQAVMAEGYPDRMNPDFMGKKDAIAVQYEAKRFGQKNGKGFYNYTQDPKGRPVKAVDPEVKALLAASVARKADVTDEDIVFRMMLPMVFEASRCLEERIVGSAMELDLSLLYGLGFPPFRGGLMRFADSIGMEKLVELSRRHRELGAMYGCTKQIEEMAKAGKVFHPLS